MTSSHTPVRILGIGSPFGDDQLGWRVVEALQDLPLRDRLPPAIVSFTACDRPGSGLIDLMQGAGLAVLVDAVQSGQPTGTLVRLEGEQPIPAAGLLSSHGLGVAFALDLGRALGCLPERVVFWGVEMGADPRLDPGAELRPEIQIAVPRLVERIASEVEGLLLGTNSCKREKYVRTRLERLFARFGSL